VLCDNHKKGFLISVWKFGVLTFFFPSFLIVVSLNVVNGVRYSSMVLVHNSSQENNKSLSLLWNFSILRVRLYFNFECIPGQLLPQIYETVLWLFLFFAQRLIMLHLSWFLFSILFSLVQSCHSLRGPRSCFVYWVSIVLRALDSFDCGGKVSSFHKFWFWVIYFQLCLVFF